MCGIGGILRRDGGTIPDEWLNIIDARIAHRGPDGSGIFRDRIESPPLQGDEDGESGIIEVALIHRRLSIIDHHGGGQPMVSKKGRNKDEGLLAVVFNGCIYNHRELRDHLTTRGHHFITDHSDTEVIIHGIREWGANVSDHLEGMYAFAAWDRANTSLILARDWFGEKPLYIRFNIADATNTIAFSSDAKSLAMLGGSELRPSTDLDQWTGRFLQLGYNWNQRTVYVSLHAHKQDAAAQFIESVPPTITTLINELVPASPTEKHTQSEIEELLRRAVHRRLEADVPLGCFLSGGIDSSLVALLAKEKKPDLRTFTIRMPDTRYDESSHAARVADIIGTQHTTLDVAIEPASDLIFLIEKLGQPFADSSLLPAYWVSKAARQHVKVALSGDGGDELFFGYERYAAARHLVRHQRALKWIPARWLRGTHPKSLKHKLARLGAMARDFPHFGILAMESLFPQQLIAELLDARISEPAFIQPGFDPMQSLRLADVQHYLPDDLLLKIDTASMAVALEVRAPFLDRDLARAVFAAPTWQLVPDGKRKGLLRSIARKYFPNEIVDRPKQGFAIPFGEWLIRDFGGLRSLLLDRLHGRDPFGPIRLNPNPVRRMVNEHLQGEADHSQRLFALLTLSIWAKSL